MPHLYFENAIDMRKFQNFSMDHTTKTCKSSTCAGYIEDSHAINIVRVGLADRMQEFFSSHSGAKKTIESIKLFFETLGHFFAVAAVSGGVVILKTFLKVAVIPEFLHDSFKLCSQIKNKENSKAIKTINLIAKNIFSTFLLGEEAGMFLVPTWLLPLATFFSFTLVGFSALELKESVGKIHASREQIAQFTPTLCWNKREIFATKHNFSKWVDAQEKILEAKQEIWQRKVKIINSLIWIVLGSLKLILTFTSFMVPTTLLLLLSAIALGSAITSTFVEKTSYKNFKKEQIANVKAGAAVTLQLLNAYRPAACSL